MTLLSSTFLTNSSSYFTAKTPNKTPVNRIKPVEPIIIDMNLIANNRFFKKTF
jgi:hypothetical protein